MLLLELWHYHQKETRTASLDWLPITDRIRHSVYTVYRLPIASVVRTPRVRTHSYILTLTRSLSSTTKFLFILPNPRDLWIKQSVVRAWYNLPENIKDWEMLQDFWKEAENTLFFTFFSTFETLKKRLITDALSSSVHLWRIDLDCSARARCVSGLFTWFCGKLSYFLFYCLEWVQGFAETLQTMQLWQPRGVPVKCLLPVKRRSEWYPRCLADLVCAENKNFPREGAVCT